MLAHPVQLRAPTAGHRERGQVFVRLLLLCGLLSTGHGAWYLSAYWIPPVIAALLLAQHGVYRYGNEDAPALARALQWIARLCAYLWLLTDRLPSSAAAHDVALDLPIEGAPTVASALQRFLLGLPALLIVCLLAMAGFFVWIAGALAVLATGSLPGPLGEFLATMLRYQFRFVAYQFSLVDRYPLFTDASLWPPEAHSGAS